MVIEYPHHLLSCLKRANDMVALIHRRKNAYEKILKLGLNAIPGSQRVPSGLRKALLVALKNESRSKTKKAINDVFDACTKTWLAPQHKKGGRKSGNTKATTSSTARRAATSSSSSSSSSRHAYATIAHDDQESQGDEGDDEQYDHGDDRAFDFDDFGDGRNELGYVNPTLSVTLSHVSRYNSFYEFPSFSHAFLSISTSPLYVNIISSTSHHEYHARIPNPIMMCGCYVQRC